MSHAGFLRDEGEPQERVIALVRALTSAGEHGVEAATAALEDLSLGDRDRVLLDYVVRLTLAPRGLRRDDLQDLLRAGLSEREAHDVVHVVCCFSYMNRLADGLGVTLPEDRWAWASSLYDRPALAQHRAWGARDPR